MGRLKVNRVWMAHRQMGTIGTKEPWLFCSSVILNHDCNDIKSDGACQLRIAQKKLGLYTEHRLPVIKQMG